MKIKRRKKNDRFAFFHMHWVEYLKFSHAINPERRLDKTLPPETKIARDRQRAAHFREHFIEGFPVRLDAIIAADLQKRGLTFTRETIAPPGKPCDP